MVAQSDIYSLLFTQRVRNDTAYDFPALVELVRPLESPRKFDALALERRLRDAAPPQSVQFLPSKVVALLRRTFWNRVSSRQLLTQTVDEHVGLTQSYVASYTSLDPLQLLARLGSCASCQSSGLKEHVREPLNGQVYCSEPCYATDFSLCY